ncbi:hypothetical protein RFI_15971 [Reticulomyxa filosa]|uniref:Uncharacterized protein n=1 Tax=Reticulomyxa filosa TaxID=46433 RepID=X6N7E3_RETFI|nr:hypothetical protein RFI_15971 [Reticulomyxa filosa]|eukprot:ETO21232.1 hypothetical protein RFI_15971 [Reticulomyxa filosa]
MSSNVISPSKECTVVMQEKTNDNLRAETSCTQKKEKILVHPKVQKFYQKIQSLPKTNGAWIKVVILKIAFFTSQDLVKLNNDTYKQHQSSRASDQTTAEKVIQKEDIPKEHHPSLCYLARKDTSHDSDSELSQVSITDDDSSLEQKSSNSHNMQKTDNNASLVPNLGDTKIATILYGVQPNVFFKMKQTIADLENEKHIISCFQNDHKWKHDPHPLHNSNYCQLFFASNMKFKLYLAIVLTIIDVIWTPERYYIDVSDQIMRITQSSFFSQQLLKKQHKIF